MRVTITADPFPVNAAEMPWSGRGQWPCQWIKVPGRPEIPFVAAFRRAFEVTEDAKVRVHVTADERYELYLDGTYIGRGSERGDLNHWYFETYDLDLTPGEHVLVARVWALGEKSAFAQFSSEPGFLLCPQEPSWQALIGTGTSDWEVKLLSGYTFVDPMTAWGTGHNLNLFGGQSGRSWRMGGGIGWDSAVKGPSGMAPGVNDRAVPHLLRPATLPPMLERRWRGATVRNVSNPPDGPTNVVPIRAADDLQEERAHWQSLVDGRSGVEIPPYTRKRVLIDLNDYVCAYPRAVLSGGSGAKVRVFWQESLYEAVDSTHKGNRDVIEGKFFTTVWHKKEGIGDTFLSGGQAGERFETLWWQAGRYVEILVETQSEPLSIDRFELIETRYPYDFTSEFSASDSRLGEIQPIMRRVLEMCSHETYMDCPYFEQLQYIGDTRLQALVTYSLTADDRLPKKALRMFDASRELSGLTQSRYPGRVRQIIPPFSLWWICMVHDYARYRGDIKFLREIMPGVRTVIDAYLAQINAAGLLGAMDGWNFVDWVPTWEGGMPKDAVGGVSSILNLQLILALRKAAQLETLIGEAELSQRCQRYADALGKQVNEAFWSSNRGLYANDLDGTEFSEHAQCLALLGNIVPADRRPDVIQGLLDQEDLDRTTIYFSHYLFEAFNAIGRTDRILERMPEWFDHPKNGLKTTIESPEPTRSDCHAWGAHPLFHYFASFLGIRPVGIGFSQAVIEPQLGPLSWARGTMPTPHGDITVEVDRQRALVILPPGIRANFVVGARIVPLRAGENIIEQLDVPYEAPRESVWSRRRNRF